MRAGSPCENGVQQACDLKCWQRREMGVVRRASVVSPSSDDVVSDVPGNDTGGMCKHHFHVQEESGRKTLLSRSTVTRIRHTSQLRLHRH